MRTGGVVLGLLALALLSPAAQAAEPGRSCQLAPGAVAVDPEPSCTYADARLGGRPGLLVQYGGTLGFAQARAEADADDACAGVQARKFIKTGDREASACRDAPARPAPPADPAPDLPAPPSAPELPPAPAVPLDAEGTAARLQASIHLEFEDGDSRHRIAAAATTPLTTAGLLIGGARGAAEAGAVQAGAAGLRGVAAEAPVMAAAAAGGAEDGDSPPLAASLATSAAPPAPARPDLTPRTAGVPGLRALVELPPELLAAPWVLLAWLLYHRLTRRQVAEHGTRTRVLAALARGPASATEVARALSLDRKTAAYHLRLLETFGLVASRPAGRERRYAPAGISAGDGLSDGARRVLAAVRAAPGATLSALAREVGMSKGTVHHHVHRLRASGAVVAERAARGLRIRPA